MDIILHKHKGGSAVTLKEDLPLLPIKEFKKSFGRELIDSIKEAIAFENSDPEVVEKTVVRTLND